MRLAQVIPRAPAGARDIEVGDLAYDDRAVKPGSLFFCVPGFKRDGHDFAAAAVSRGAVALVVERSLSLGTGVPEIVVESVREEMARAAAAFNGDPTASLQVVGVTGTNGKTTTTFLIRALLEAAGRRCALLGTVKNVIGGIEHPVVRTTPEAIELQRDFRAMLDAGDGACAMEVSSHALALHRTDAIHYAAAIFTNLSRDHLDFHPTMDSYFDAKRRLFEPEPRVAIVNVDDPYGARLADGLRSPVSFALERDASFRALHVETDLSGMRFEVQAADARIDVRSSLRGRFNVYNLLGALAAACALGIGLQDAVVSLENAGQVPGRLEPVDEDQGFAVLVDYAHTPDSLQNVLLTARALTGARVHVVFGCGGDRDRGKRALMGEIAARLADGVIVTSDNPRSEDPEAIIREILAGAGGAARGGGTGRAEIAWLVDRRAAITEAIAQAGPGDVVVIAGKGHEQGQEFAGGRKVPFDDVTVARAALGSLRGAQR